MTLDGAIEERQKVIKAQEKLYEEASTNESKEIIKSATDNDRQLAEWLRELKDLREENKDWKEEYANLNKISYGFYKELKEAKRLLKVAVEDLNATVAEVYNGGVICECCKWKSQIGECCCSGDGGCDTDYRWRYTDEAEKLLNDEK